MHSLILKVATRLLVGLILVFAVYLLFRGHNAPGGGFVAALVAGTGFALAAISEGPAVVRSAIRIDPERIAMYGLGLAILCGLVGWLAGRPFLTGLWWIVTTDNSKALAIGTP
ncbi:MAG: MnhB domain-containing protein, partial [Desulfobacterales bacterium]